MLPPRGAREANHPQLSTRFSVDARVPIFPWVGEPAAGLGPRTTTVDVFRLGDGRSAVRAVRRATIGVKLTVIAVVACVGMLAIGGLAAAQVRNDRFADREASTRAEVQTAVGMVAYFRDQAAHGVMTTAQAQAAALGALKTLRYGTDDYFWVNTYDAHMVMHPTKPTLDGTDVST
jgi:hypothetical protein